MKRLAVAVVLLAACKNQIDQDKAQSAIRDDLAGKKVTIKSVDCPAGREIKKGDTFDCTVTTDTGTATVHVEQQDDEGTVHWKLAGRVLDLKDYGDGLAKKAGNGIHVDCGAGVRIIQTGDKLPCTTKNPDGKIEVDVTDNDGTVNIKQL